MINLKRRKKTFVVPLSSMSDVAFLLLIFIMLVSLINYRKEVKIDYPEAETARKTSAEDNIEIWVDRNGALYLNGDAAHLNTIENAIAEAYRVAPATRVHIIADKNTPYKDVAQVLQYLQLLQYRVVSFVVANE